MSTVQPLEDLSLAFDGSFYTIAGAGGDIKEWTAGYEKMLEEQGIGKPVAWYTTTGAAVNAFAGQPLPNDSFQPDLTFLLFPWTGLAVGKLAALKLAMQDRWFDDVIDNMRMHATEQEEEEEEEEEE